MLRPVVVSLLLSLSLLGGCGSMQKSSPTRIDLNITGSDKLNPDLHGRPSPIVLRIYELKNPVAFEHAEFFALYQQPQETLSLDLVAHEELELRPGKAHRLKLTTREGNYLAVLAAYRNLPEADWRAVVPLRAGETNAVELHLDELSIRPVTRNTRRGK